jgi:hypothetical protein
MNCILTALTIANLNQPKARKDVLKNARFDYKLLLGTDFTIDSSTLNLNK